MLFVLLVISTAVTESPADAATLGIDEHCQDERAEAEKVPVSEEDVRAYRTCVDHWQAAIAAEAAAREAARRKTEEDAQEAVERARTERQKPMRDARGLVLLGSLLFAGGGAAATIAGGIGIAALATPATKSTDVNGIALGMGMLLGIAGGAIMIPGAVILGLGARDHARAKRAMVADSGNVWAHQ